MTQRSIKLSRRSLLLGSTALAAAVAAPGTALARLVESPGKIDPNRIMHNWVTGESVRFIGANHDAVIFNWTVEPAGRIPFEHWHGEQDEVFKIQSGTMRFWLNGEAVDASAGQTLRVRAGVHHTGANMTDEPVRAVVSLEPGLDGLAAFQIYWGLCEDGFVNKNGHPRVLLLAALNRHLEGRHCPSSVPPALYEATRKIYRKAINRPKYRAMFERYTGHKPLLGLDDAARGLIPQGAPGMDRRMALVTNR